MKILHISDLHIGNVFNGIDRKDEFNQFFEFLGDTIKKEQIQLLIIAGDIFDVYFPSNEALKQYYNFLASLDIKVVIIGGNHDSFKTLQTPKEILKYLDIEIISGDEDDYFKIIEFDDFVLVAVSFIRDAFLRKIDENINTALKKVYQDLLKEAKKYNKKVFTTGHLSVSGSKIGDSERDIYIGNLQTISNSIFDGFDYVALGHIHKYQKISNSIFYSGSVLPLSFSEKDDKKMILIDSENLDIKTINIPKFREFVSLKGDKEEIFDKLNKITKDSFVEIEFEEFVSKIELDEIKKMDLNIVKIKLPYKETKIDEIKNVTPIDIVKELFEDDEVLELFKKIQKEVEDENQTT